MKMAPRPDSIQDQKFDLIKLKDGDSVTGIVVGDFYTFFSLYNGKFFELSQRGREGAKFRFRVNFAVKEGSGFVLKVLEQGSGLYDALRELNEEFPLETTPITIKRKGSSAKDTEYSCLPSAKTKFTKEEAAYLATLEPIDLRHQETIQDDKFNEI